MAYDPTRNSEVTFDNINVYKAAKEFNKELKIINENYTFSLISREHAPIVEKEIEIEEIIKPEEKEEPKKPQITNFEEQIEIKEIIPAKKQPIKRGRKSNK